MNVKYQDPTLPVTPEADAIRQLIAEYCARHHRFKFDPANPRVRLHEPTIGAEEINAALDVLLSTKVTQGPKVAEFEERFAKMQGRPYGVACNSGSSANLLLIASLRALGKLPQGGEVIVSALSWSTTVWPLIQHGLVPVFVDCSADTLNMDRAALSRAITPRTMAIMPVHVYGNPCDMDALMDVATEHGLLVIEDCCEAMGAEYRGQPVGSFGIGASFSFYLSHHITTLEGGVAITGDAALAEMLRVQRAHGWVRDVKDKGPYAEQFAEFDPRFLFVDLGYNLRMTDVQAAIGLVQLPKLAGYTTTRNMNNIAYRASLAKYPFFRFQETTPGGRSSCFDFAVLLHDAPFTVREICGYLAERNIETRPIICGNLVDHPAVAKYEHRVVGDLCQASNVRQNGFALGNHHFIDAAAQKYVVGAIEDFIRGTGA